MILGSFPSPQSRAQGFYYGHEQNRFWPLLADLLEEPLPESIAEKKNLLLHRRIALWDVLERCDIQGASDASIRGAVVNDFRPLLQNTTITRVYTNGTTAFRLYERHARASTGLDAVCLPSTSPANCRVPYEQLRRAWQLALFERE